MSEQSLFGTLYKNHHWVRTPPSVAAYCVKCGTTWYPHMTSRDIKWCKGMK